MFGACVRDGQVREATAGSFSAWIDMVRWLAAGSVLITHTGLRMLVPVSDMPVVSVPHVAYAFAAGFDHQAVMVFFVLSGLLVGGSIMREIAATGGFAPGPYVVRRLVRLCIVLWPAFALGAVCVSAALVLGAGRHGILPPGTSGSLGLAVLLCNAVFLQTVACPQYAGNGALWSLFNEAWYYALFPPLALAVAAALPRWKRLALGGAALGILVGLTAVQFTGSPVGPYMLVWAVGAAVAVVPRPVMRRPWMAGGLFVLASLAVRLFVRRAFAGSHPLLSAELDLLLAITFGNLLLTLRCCPALRPPPWPSLHARLAGFSFSLYCTHLPVLALYITLLATTFHTGWQMEETGPAPWVAVGGGLVLCICVAWCFAQLTEAHTARLHTTLIRRWPARRLA